MLADESSELISSVYQSSALDKTLVTIQNHFLHFALSEICKPLLSQREIGLGGYV